MQKSHLLWKILFHGLLTSFFRFFYVIYPSLNTLSLAFSTIFPNSVLTRKNGLSPLIYIPIIVFTIGSKLLLESYKT